MQFKLKHKIQRVKLP